MGQIIRAELLSMKPEKYKKMIMTTEMCEEYKKLESSNLITKEYMSSKIKENEIPPNCTALFEKDIFFFSAREFITIYHIKEAAKKGTVWHKLRNINYKNRLTERIIKIVGEKQSDFLNSGDKSKLIHLPYSDLIKIIGYDLGSYPRTSCPSFKSLPGCFPEVRSSKPPYIDESVISRIAHSSVVRLHSGTSCLLELLPHKSTVTGNLIRKVVESSKKELTDREIASVLFESRGIELSRRYITYCREATGIPNSAVRKRRVTPYSDTSFSDLKPFHKDTIQSLPAESGIYELSKASAPCYYKKGESPIIYIGATNNLRERLQTYINGYGHTLDIRNFILSEKLNYRYLLTNRQRETESHLINSFFFAMGELPSLNRLKPA